jgi:mercuric ion transport protein
MSIPEITTGSEAKGRTGLFAVGGLAGALLASSCCVLPFLFVSLGVSGAWIGQLTALSPYQPFFLGAAVALLGAGFWQAYRHKPEVCLPGTVCAKPQSGPVIKSILWIGAAFVFAALAVDLAPLIG